MDLIIKNNAPYQWKPLFSIMEARRDLEKISKSFEYPFNDEEWDKYYTDLNLESFYIYQNDQLIGHYSLRDLGGETWISHFLIKKEFRSQNIGSVVISMIDRPKLRALVHPENQAAIKFYMKNNFEFMGMIDRQIGMRKIIQSNQT
jgi:ribosomal protein S18 acetylase RimI-like enzyme